MLKLKHTPGPWYAHYTDANIDDQTRTDVTAQKTDHIVASCFSGDIAQYEAEANARLIAAAPELLKWLKVAEEMLGQTGAVCEFTLGACKNMSEMAAAIAKAEGEHA